MTETWERLEYLAVEPPAAFLLHYIAQWMGYKPAKTGTNTGTSSSHDIQSALGSFPKQSYEQLPEYIKNSPSFQKLVAEMRP